MSAGPYLPPASSEKFDRLKDILRTMFQLDRGDLDFGLYRIMNLKAAEIMAFLDNDLLPQVRDVLNLTSDEERARLEKALQTAQKQARGLGIDPDTTPKVSELKQQLAEAKADAAAETDVYNHLANFFARYYDEGDFMSLRRYSGGGQSSYLIPYNGEEVKLHWANADQYYIKSTENYASYVFTVGAEKRRVRFEIAKADNEKDNVKEASGKQRRFVLAESETAQSALSVLRLRPSGATLSTNEPPDPPATSSGPDAAVTAAPLSTNEPPDLPERSGAESKEGPGLSAVEGAVETDNSELVIRFEHRPLTEHEKRTYPGNNSKQQDRINEATAKRILEALESDWLALLATLAPTESNPDRTVLDKHLATYTARNSFDYFIHKDLGGFLRRELDLYLKNDVLNVDDLEAGDAARLHRALARMRATRHVADKIIIFLAQIEDFQKQLWLKKKFALETQYCVTLDRVPDGLYAEIVTNEAQHDEWVRLFAIDEIEGDLANGNTGYTNPLTVEFLKTNPYLALDTRHFDRDFTDRLLAALSEAGPLDEQLDGLLVHGENFQALNLLQARYREQVKCVYIDPPYNTDASAILYKNDYKDSSWLSLLADRLTLARDCLVHDGILCVAIDDEEVSLLRLVMRDLFERELGIVSVRSNPAGRKSRGQFSPTHEYALFFGNAAAVPGTLDKTENELARYPLTDEEGRYAWNNLIRHGSNDMRQDRPKLFYPVYISKDDTLRVPAMEWDADKQEYKILEETRKDEVAVWPTRIQDGGVVEKNWHRGPERITSTPSDYRIRRSEKVSTDEHGIKIDFKIRIDLNSMPKTWWDDKRYASANLGAKVLKDIFGEKDFDFAKAIGLVEDCLRASLCESRSLVLDFFAGSGSTGHAVINLNREDGGRRKCILVEMGEHFDSVLLPRLKKVIYSSDWKDGKPISRNGSTQFFKYIRLESYEDTLDSLEVRPPSTDQQALLSEQPTLAEDYRLRYALGEETAESACLLGKHFTDPFAYTLSVVRDGVRQEVPVDLPETFNYLIGLRVESRQRRDGVLTIIGMDAEGKRCLILWRNLNELDNSTLEAWFLRHRPTFGALDLIYVNGDHTLNALRGQTESWTAQTTEPVFRALTFEEEEYGR